MNTIEMQEAINELIKEFALAEGYLEDECYHKLKTVWAFYPELNEVSIPKHNLYLIWSNSRCCDSNFIAASLKMWKDLYFKEMK